MAQQRHVIGQLVKKLLTCMETAKGEREDLQQNLIDAMEADLDECCFRALRLNELPPKQEHEKATEGKKDSVGFSMFWAATGVNVAQPVNV